MNVQLMPQNWILKNGEMGVPAMAQEGIWRQWFRSLQRRSFDPAWHPGLKDPALLQLPCKSQLWSGFNAWSRNFHMPWVQSEGKKKYIYIYTYTHTYIYIYLVLGVISFFFFFLAPCAIWHSQCRDQIQDTAPIYVATMAAPGLQPTVQGQGLNLCPSAPEIPLILLCHSGNSQKKNFNW